MKFKSLYGNEITLKQYVTSRLSAGYESGGAVEQAQETSDNVKHAFANLLDVLATKGMLTQEDIHKVVTGE